jgi:Carboxymuconolactone decarboxylase family.
MARISYVEEKDHPELAADIAKIKGARGGLINIYKLLLHSPTVTMTWFEHIGAIRWKTKLTPRLREIAIVRVAQAARYAYALNQHVPASRCRMA